MQLTFWRNDETSTFGRSSVDSLDNIDELNPCELPWKIHKLVWWSAYFLLVRYSPVAVKNIAVSKWFGWSVPALTSYCYYPFPSRSWYAYFYKMLSDIMTDLLLCVRPTGRRTLVCNCRTIRTSCWNQELPWCRLQIIRSSRTNRNKEGYSPK